MIQWLRRRFVTGFFVLVPLAISVFALVWIFNVVDGFTAPLFERYFASIGRDVPPGLGIVLTMVVVLLVGVLATNVLGKRVLQRAEGYLLRIPVFRTVYAPVKQLVLAFSPDNENGFKRVVMILPTNHLYLGDVVICQRDDAVFPDLSVEEGIRVFLTGGMTLPGQLADKRFDNVTGRS
jgi:uncharacterized membrane protein